MEQRKYYEAYDDRYCQVHRENLQWSSDVPTPIVMEVAERFGISDGKSVLELGCGEGRDAVCLLRKGLQLTATDISPEAIGYCRSKYPQYDTSFTVLDCVNDRLGEKFDYIYAVAVVHMLVVDNDRNAFYCFIREHLTEGGIGLVCTMGDGKLERSTDIRTAFDLQQREHTQTGKKLLLAGTSCRMVNFDTFLLELKRNGLNLLEHGLTAAEPDFPVMMYAVVKKS